jgi:hypothetical protein
LVVEQQSKGSLLTKKNQEKEYYAPLKRLISLEIMHFLLFKGHKCIIKGFVEVAHSEGNGDEEMLAALNSSGGGQVSLLDILPQVVICDREKDESGII